MLAVEELNAWYGQAQALFGVNLTVGEGELVVIQGLNGAVFDRCQRCLDNLRDLHETDATV